MPKGSENIMAEEILSAVIANGKESAKALEAIEGLKTNVGSLKTDINTLTVSVNTLQKGITTKIEKRDKKHRNLNLRVNILTGIVLCLLVIMVMLVDYIFPGFVGAIEGFIDTFST